MGVATVIQPAEQSQYSSFGPVQTKSAVPRVLVSEKRASPCWWISHVLDVFFYIKKAPAFHRISLKLNGPGPNPGFYESAKSASF
jgi:hypothetical protein